MPRRDAMLRRALERRGLRAHRALTVGLLAAAGLSCSEKGRSLILVAMDADPSLTTLAKVELKVLKDGTPVATKTFDWKTGMVNHFGVYIPKSVVSPVTLIADGKDANETRIAAVTTSPAIQVEAGGTSLEIVARLEPLRHDGPDGGTGTGGVGTGTGGAAPGTGGVGGSGTGGGATGGSGLGGAAATGGRGGAGPATGGAGPATGGAGGATGTGPSWRGAKIVEPDVLVANWTPAVAVDAAGNAVLVYRRGTGIRASRYNAATDAWSAPVGVETRAGGQAYSPQIAVDKNGNWLVVWQQDENMSLKGLWQSTSSDGTTWTAPSAITTALAFAPSLAMNRDGTAVAAWYTRDTTAGNFPAVASVRTGGTWSTPTVLKASNSANGYPEQTAAITGTGEAYVVWQDTDGGAAGQYSIWMRRFSGGTWAPAALVENYDAGGADTQSVAANASGQVIIAWRQAGATVDEMWARRYTTGGVATAPVSLGQAEWISWDPLSSATIDDTGVSTVTWSIDVQGKFNTYVNRAAHAAAFPADPTAIETDNQAAPVNNALVEAAKIYPMLGSDGAGNVVVVWRKNTGGRFDLYGRRFSGGTWGTASLLEEQNTADIAYPVVAVGSGGTAVVAWYYQNDSHIWANVLR